MKFLKWFKKKEVPPIPETLPPPEPQETQLDRIEANTSYIRENMAREETLKESVATLSQRLEQVLQPLPQKTKDVIETLQHLDKHQALLNFFTNQEFSEEYHTYQQISEGLEARGIKLNPTTIKVYIKELIRLGYEIEEDHRKYGKKKRYRLNPEAIKRMLEGKSQTLQRLDNDNGNTCND